MLGGDQCESLLLLVLGQLGECRFALIFLLVCFGILLTKLD